MSEEKTIIGHGMDLIDWIVILIVVWHWIAKPLWAIAWWLQKIAEVH